MEELLESEEGSGTGERTMGEGRHVVGSRNEAPRLEGEGMAAGTGQVLRSTGGPTRNPTNEPHAGSRSNTEDLGHNKKTVRVTTVTNERPSY